MDYKAKVHVYIWIRKRARRSIANQEPGSMQLVADCQTWPTFTTFSNMPNMALTGTCAYTIDYLAQGPDY